MRTFGSFTKMGNPHKRGIIWLYLITDYGNFSVLACVFEFKVR